MLKAPGIPLPLPDVPGLLVRTLPHSVSDSWLRPAQPRPRPACYRSNMG